MSTNPQHIVFLDGDTMAESVSLPAFGFTHTLTVYPRTRPEQLAERIAEADIVITNKVAIGADALTQAKQLKLIAIAATGSDMIDLASCKEHGVAVCNIRNYATNTVPEHVLALMFALRRSLVPYRQSVQNGRWQEADQFCYFDYPIYDLAGSTLGIVGAGSLGQSVAKLAQALGMKTVFAEQKGVSADQVRSGRVPFEDMLRQADVISLHCPLTPQTEHLLSTAEFNLMKPGRTVLINTARGGLVDNEALEQALRSGQLGGAGIDVCTPEPPPADHILMRLLDLPNFILTPHVAWASQEAMQALANQLVDNINAFVAGQAQNLL
ncbi:D-2-hydroxyacid dehydrogenase [Alcaligenes endophyticus]|uniref:D-2-hydroxyacid dehydrogenase n=1 Tax=Alcaligenes endophyticus TaxID=1929088 RepID=A0ABT8EJL5_9BURK|nr:D-2-hydroxyacid dehydrogenase [Alcaligenes endophyticus]MCX5591796.1 D-2-hydroxyacid dehydrogenase [Alcaligenes endophyticus]MDN4121473.1 D-2-hydroxyacid dehydrogenase [Alcaligenes endophyticus]